MTPINGWKAYYAATRAIMNVNAEFFKIIKERSLPAMERFWLNADYVKCFHASGEYFTGYEFFHPLRGSLLSFTTSSSLRLHLLLCSPSQPPTFFLFVIKFSEIFSYDKLVMLLPAPTKFLESGFSVHIMCL